MKGMPCRPGDVAVVIGLPPGMLVEGLLGRWVRVTTSYPCPCCGDAVWRLEQPVETVALLGGGWVEVLIPAVADDYLQPIRGPRQAEASTRSTDQPEHTEV